MTRSTNAVRAIRSDPDGPTPSVMDTSARVISIDLSGTRELSDLEARFRSGFRTPSEYRGLDAVVSDATELGERFPGQNNFVVLLRNLDEAAADPVFTATEIMVQLCERYRSGGEEFSAVLHCDAMRATVRDAVAEMNARIARASDDEDYVPVPFLPLD